MPSKSTTFDDEQYRYIVNTQDDDESFSERVRDLVNLGIEAEKDGERVEG